MFHVADHADDRDPTRRPGVTRPTDARTDRVVTRKELPNEFLVCDRDQRLPFAIHFSEVATRTQGNLHRSEVLTHHGKGLYLGLITLRNRRTPIDDEIVFHIISTERNIGDHSNLHARQRIQASQQVAAELCPLGNFGITSGWQLEVHGHYAGRVEPWIHGTQARETFDEEAGSREENESKCYFCGYQDLANSMARCA